MPFWKCYYHIIWATKHRLATITPEREAFFFQHIPLIAKELGSHIFAINGTEDHIHIATIIPPKIAISQWVKRVKGASSNQCNQIITNEERFHWQGGYGVLTFGKTNPDYVVQYIQNQKQHHAEDSTQSYLEQIDE